MNTDYNLIINFAGSPLQLEALKERITSKTDGKTANVAILTLNNLQQSLSAEEKELLQKLTNCSRVYVIDHGTPNSHHISSTYYADLADFFSNHINKNQLIIKEDNPRELENLPITNTEKISPKIRFSFISCHSAEGNNNSSDSFAGLFHRYLGQVHGINADVIARKQVVIINDKAGKKGKMTTSLAQYGMLSLSYKYNSKWLKKWSELKEKNHQMPETKSTFKWDKEGREFVIDSYIDKFIKKANILSSSICALVDKQILTQNDKEKIVGQVCFIQELLKNPQEVDGKKIKEVVQYLTEINDSIGEKELNHAIQELIIFASHSIKQNAKKAFLYEACLQDPPSEEIKPIADWVKTNIYAPALSELKKMAKTEMERPLKRITTEFLQILGDNSVYKKKTKESLQEEMEIANFIKIALHITNNTTLNKEEKCEIIDDLIRNLEKDIQGKIIVSPAFSGYFKGLKEAYNYGGLTTFKLFGALSYLRAEEREKRVKTYASSLESFITELSHYLSKQS